MDRNNEVDGQGRGPHPLLVAAPLARELPTDSFSDQEISSEFGGDADLRDEGR